MTTVPGFPSSEDAASIAPPAAGHPGRSGGAFVVIYLICAFAIGMPLLVSELAIGRLGRSDPAGSYRALAARSRRSTTWAGVGSLAVLCVFAVISFYTVLAGWTFECFVRAVTGQFVGLDAEESSSAFAVFGWLVPHGVKQRGLGMQDGPLHACVTVMLRLVIPPVLVTALLLGLAERAS